MISKERKRQAAQELQHPLVTNIARDTLHIGEAVARAYDAGYERAEYLREEDEEECKWIRRQHPEDLLGRILREWDDCCGKSRYRDELRVGEREEIRSRILRKLRERVEKEVVD